MMLAEDFATNVNWTLIFTGLMASSSILLWLDARRVRATVITPQPLSVSGAPLGNSELQMGFKQLNARVKILEEWRADLVAKMESDKTEILNAGEDRARRIYTHVEDVRRELDGKLSNMPGEIVALLKNTGSI